MNKALKQASKRGIQMRITRDTIGIAILMLCGTVFSATAQTAKGTSTSPATSKAQAYCASTGGNVETRIPVYGTNGPVQSWLRLAGVEYFCQYTSASDGSRIHVSLRTLVATKPSLAALAYYAQIPWNGVGQGSPASFYCSQLGGSDLFGGVNAAGGGWVKFNTTDVSLDACIFPDNSTIDSWGLFYHSAGIIRGADLSTVLRYSNPYTATKTGTQ
jgi:putative hemolysin